MTRIHILGVCGTFMGGVALLAKQAGFDVSGSDANVYPPMSTLLASSGVTLHEGYEARHLEPVPDQIVVGNVMSRGQPVVEYLLNQDISYVSGPQWLSEHVLRGRSVLAVAGTHGKTTTTSILTWMLEYAGLAPGFLVGGVPANFGVSARLGADRFFVVEADEYDTAFFDKRSKFVHYRPRILILNNLEFDHADIFEDLKAIKRQFHHLVRTVPGSGLIVHNDGDENLHTTLKMGCWTPCQSFALEREDTNWSARLVGPDGSRFEVLRNGTPVGQVRWTQYGVHNVANALAALAAAYHAGVSVSTAIQSLAEFKGVKRRLEVRGRYHGITLYDDFAHHPTAIRATLAALRACVGDALLVAVLEPRSNTMRMGVHKDELADALTGADRVIMYQPPDLRWSARTVTAALGQRAQTFDSVRAIVDVLRAELMAGDHVLIMSNGGFGGLHGLLAEALATRPDR
ncbi:MAG TPA: UDP-N-acetylmuramate:L-alanyl-gamma-D-glutamyl-meso-diaminopimelate ligase [Gammaproteobacteria bacterium]|nr:UDP-N-acetylmuramate:L-alanyl-gamma-D-glutamyl-meso-diaminopimelate ligase [Gammaproteobacteria bacterium]